MHTILHTTETIFLKLRLTLQNLNMGPMHHPTAMYFLPLLLESSHQRSPQQLKSYAGIPVIFSVVVTNIQHFGWEA
jgi:hypothetical protein